MLFFSEATVREAMRLDFVSLLASAQIGHAIRQLIKFKANATLVMEANGTPLGVVSKTDIMGTYYAGLPLNSPVADIMVSPPLYRPPKYSLASVLNIMRERHVYRLYVRDESQERVLGLLA